MKRFCALLGAALAVTTSLPTPTRAELPVGTLKPNDLFMPYLGGVVVFKSTFDLTDPVRGWFIERTTHGLADMRGTTIGPDGNFYLAATPGDVGGFSDSILRFNGTTGQFMDEFVPPGSGGLSYPQGLAFLPDGNLYVASGTGDVLRYNGQTGAFINVAISAATWSFLVPNPDYPDFSDEPMITVGGGPTDLVFGADGRLYIGVSTPYGAEVAWYNPNTGLVGTLVTLGSGGLGFPYQMVFGPDGNLYVADGYGAAVKVYSGTTGEFIDRFPAGFGDLVGANGLAFGPDGYLYVDGATIAPEGYGTGVIDLYDPAGGAYITRLISPENFPPTGAGGGRLLFNKTVTQTGSSVTVAPLPTTNLTFSNITSAGQTIITPLYSDTTPIPANVQAPPLPNNVQAPPPSGGFLTYFDVTTTATFTGPVTLSFTYDPAQFQSDQHPELPAPVILHYDSSYTNPVNGSHWKDITTSFDPVAYKVYGNTLSFSPFAIVRKLDTTPPAITVPVDITAAATGTTGTIVSFSASANDDFDGSVPVTYSRQPGTTFPLGTTTVTVTARDAAGNSATRTFQVTVSYTWSGILQPINADGSSTFKKGSTVPVKFQLTGASAGITKLQARLFLSRSDSVNPANTNEEDEHCDEDDGFVFRYDPTSHQYVYNLRTKEMDQGTWYLWIDLGDGVQHVVRIKLKK